MLLLGSTLSPFVRKTNAFVLEKGLDVELQQVRPGDTDPTFRAASPLGKIPGFKDGEFTISDSTAIITYLDVKHPDPNLIPADAANRARTIWFEEFADTVLAPCVGKVFFNRVVAPKFMGQPGDAAAADACEADELPGYFAYLEGVLPDSGFLVDDRITLADLAVASPFVNFAHADVKIDAATYPKLTQYLAAMHARPSFAGMIAGEKAMMGG
ncbi:MAG TPA: glutathione S-transferase family protein [Caulobacteraceae bacterium]|nr:glutathione S-transferase family protein [Caulobacteraceae bacterium]